MQSLWSEGDAEAMVAHYGAAGITGDVALRVYTSRLLGGDPRLVLHGGGNTSVKTVLPDLLGDPAEVLCVKGSGWDMANIEPPGLPAVRLAPLRKLRQRDALSDEEMVRVQRANLLDPGAPNPSVETLLHAFLPHKFIDHTHATAVLSPADQPDPAVLADPAEVAPILRGACALPDPASPGHFKRFVLDFRSGPAVRNFVDGAEVKRYGLAGVATPDHTIRTKNYPLIVPPPERGDLDQFGQSAREAVGHFVAEYHEYFARHNAASAVKKRELDPVPRVILIPGLGLFGLGRSAKDAAVAADLAESWVATVTDAEAVGTFESLSEAELFEMEYWSLEQAKLGSAVEKPLAGQVALVTGGAGTIGLATARALKNAGAEIALIDRDGAGAEDSAKQLGGLGLVCDVTDPAAMRAAFDGVAERFGGIDIVVSNAGAAWQGRIGEVDDAVLRESFELNFFAHQSVAQSAVRIMRTQGTGGCLLFNVSRQAVSPGPNAGPYGLPKAATLFLMRQYALEYGADGIRANAVNADGIRGGLLTPEFIKERAAAYGLSEADYMARNLLGRE